DTIFPIVNITSPYDGQVFNLSVPSSFDYTVSESTGVCWYSINGGDNSSSTPAGWSFYSPFSPPLASGQNNLTIYCNDSAGNVNLSSLSFVLSNTCTPPVAGIWNLLCADNCSYGTAINIPGDVNISGTGLINISANWNFTSSNQYVYVEPGCELNIYSGGGFNIA
ncbi:MAG: hypothetical protein KKE50_01955, partial [Nanoarchaeota archaeon]|nr:hypothetical protein [Nanoarchaeota archaeon]